MKNMEKRTPHYELAEIQKTVADPAARPFTVTALHGGACPGFDGTRNAAGGARTLQA
ncbi:MAG: hypothetical protein P4L43_08740 [Syntrophobacteraceae bacterium]|nr:hypothetical protein [Syntrophobacteraceae bacterium]